MASLATSLEPGGGPEPKPVSQVGTADPMVVGITEAMVAAHPELADVRSLYLAGNYAGALNALYASEFYKNTSATKFSNEQLKLNQPGVYEDTINNNWIPTLRNLVTTNGLEVSDANLTAIAKKAFDMGLSPTAPATLEFFKVKKDASGNVVPNTLISGISGGTASTARQNLVTLNAQYGTSFNNDWVAKAAESVATGGTTEQYWTDQIKAQAAGAFPAWADQIKAGQTVQQIASPYINTYANILGVDAASVTLNDNLIKKGLQGTDPANPGAMPLWQFEKAVRQDPRWPQSKDAIDSLNATGSTILRQWGLMA